MTEQPEPTPEQQPAKPAEPVRPAGTKIVFGDPLARQTSDDTDAAWGESSGGRGLDWYLSQRPPHHGD
ncbi:hypothetical protein [Kitasatospora viridis]|uniref:Uncharacterized protein n=1 Tax=Kitasatospora viridis TaxID=281105 RepID=A0A561UG06_9ACTN|nr:hypothetical protein [Kitasatospora viridis]TWF98299.1 hypothetical protein FHX73_112106 [Kitasatospora viridis]